MKECVILVSNNKYLTKALATIRSIRTAGNYHGEIVLLIGNDLLDNIDNLVRENITVKHFPDLNREQYFELYRQRPVSSGAEIHKAFQFHKLYLFHPWIKDNYDKCFYIDAGMQVYKDLRLIMNQDCSGKLIAHSDAYPTYEWRLKNQFDTGYLELYQELYDTYDMEIDYFQSTMMVYDTNIIEEDTFNKLVELSNKYLNSRTNDQGILNIYFTLIKKVWQQSQIKDEKTHYYDFWEREALKWYDYIMLKYPRTR